MSTDGSSESLELRFSEEPRSGSAELREGNSSESPGYKKPEGTYFTFQNRDSLAHDLTFLSVMPDLCDVTFLVGEERQPVCGVKAIMAARSCVFRRMLYRDAEGKKSKKFLKKKGSEGSLEGYDLRHQQAIVVKEFDPEVFKQLVEYVHTGSVMLQARTILGLMNASDHYGVEGLKAACTRFVERCVTVDMVCCLLASAERYIQYKSTKMVVQRIFEFVDQNAMAILSLGAFYVLPQHVVRIILSREELKATELAKFEAALKWCDAHLDETNVTDLRHVFEPFANVVDYYQIPARELMQVVKPLKVVDDAIILMALAYQADPTSVDQSAILRQRRVKLNATKMASSPFMRRAMSTGVPLLQNRIAVPPRGLDGSRGGSVPPAAGGSCTRGGGDSNDNSPTTPSKGLHSIRLLEAGSRSGSVGSHISTGSSASGPLLASSGSVSSLSAVELETDAPTMTVVPELGCRSMSVDVGLNNGHCLSIDV